MTKRKKKEEKHIYTIIAHRLDQLEKGRRGNESTCKDVFIYNAF